MSYAEGGNLKRFKRKSKLSKLKAPSTLLGSGQQEEGMKQGKATAMEARAPPLPFSNTTSRCPSPAQTRS